MKLIIDDTEQNLIPIKDFRATHNLPDNFGIAQFEPKDFEGLGSLDNAGGEMNTLRENILNLIPESIGVAELMRFIDHLQLQFQTDLFAINDAVELQDVEVEFAVAGFGDVLRSMMYKMIPAKANQQDMPSFEVIYAGWLNDSVRVSSQTHEYQHNDKTWQIQVINNVYGRVGLRVEMDDTVTYIIDGVYSCPAEGFMYTLLKDLTYKIWRAIATVG